MAQNFTTSIPTTDSQMRNTYIVGKDSIITNLPRPKVKLISEHSYVSPRQCISHFLGSGKMPPNMTNTDCKKIRLLTESRACKEVYERACTANANISKEDLIVLMGITWSDDFDPNSSIKANRGAVWIKTLTFVSTSFSENKVQDTYPISIGLKEVSHDIIEREFISELESLKSGENNVFFSMKLKRNVTVHFEVIACLGDQPERRCINYLMLGNSKFGARFAYAADVESIANNLPMCKFCLQKCKDQHDFLESGYTCNHCLQWDMMENNILSRYDPPSKYPQEMIPDDGKLSPIKLSFDILKSTVTLATHKFLCGDWSETTLRCYVSSMGINTAGNNHIIDHCNNIAALKFVQTESKVNQDMKKAIFLDYQQNEEKYKEWRGGDYWNSSMKLDNFVDVIMHLLFLGVAKASKELLSLWMKDTKKLKQYQTVTKDLFSTISDMGLEWCKLITSESGWVSDNYLGFTRIIKWVYHPVCILQSMERLHEPYIEPDIPVKRWYVQMCKDWLDAHGVEFNGKISELKEKIESLKANVQSPPKLKQMNDLPIHIVDHFIGSLLSTIASIMTKEVDKDSISKVDREIKIYLTNLDNLQMKILSIRSDESIPVKEKYWLRKYNFLSLMNIPGAMMKYGSLTHLWEGSNQGEGYLRYVKPRISDIHSKQWHLKAHVKLLNETAMDDVINCYITNNASTHQKNEYIQLTKTATLNSKKMFHKYKSVNEIFSYYRRNRPISCVKCENGQYYVVVESVNNTNVHGINILFKFKFNIPSLSMDFHEIEINEMDTGFDLVNFKKTDITNYMMLLPQLNIDGYINIKKSSLYYIIDSKWNELNEKMEFTSPKSPGCKYN